MKKIKYLMFILCFLLVLSGCIKKENKKENTSTPIIFEVTKEGYDNKLYLFGSIHVADDSMYPLSDNIIDAYERSDYLAVEFDLVDYMQDLSSQINDIIPFMYEGNNNIKNDISDELYDETKEILEHAGLYSSLYDRYKPILWMSLVESAVTYDTNLDEQEGIDMYFINKAKEDNKNIIELESANYQYSILSSFDIDMQIYLLEESVKNYSDSINDMKKLYEIYKRGEKEEIENYLFNETDMNEYEEMYNDVLINIRNQNMAKLLEENYTQGKNIFCTVGLAHIVGEDGIVSLLQKNGYKVEVI